LHQPRKFASARSRSSQTIDDWRQLRQFSNVKTFQLTFQINEREFPKFSL
jgi:hypothetical protein